ncbi:uncharacterized protein B0T15DRAFT_509015 [Chaetomium strumarium]|uniref:Uncharacterized protein n=1 Tax=Chaetomium strumarium TaxID=1170767 RepID=A0AAJ0GYP3_9PEZI|nr:hypothetical protein B0T15DRAFT_509015 [Chaetomium strumarium]
MFAAKENNENVLAIRRGGNGLGKSANNENTLTARKGVNGLDKSGKPALVTPAAPRTARAPLGNKTTNAKARATHQTPAGKTPAVKGLARDFEKTTIKPTTNLRPKPSAPRAEASPSKLEVHADTNSAEEEIEYAPPRPHDIQYESDVFPDGVLTFEGLKPENLFKGYYQYYFNRVDDEGKTAMEREMEARQQQRFQRGEEQILRDMDEFDWSIGDIPESKELPKQKAKTAPARKTVPVPKAAQASKTAQVPRAVTGRKVPAGQKAARPGTLR